MDPDLRRDMLYFRRMADVANCLAEKHDTALSVEDKKMYLKILKENFNYAVHENALKWYDCEIERDSVDYSIADRIWEICNDLNIPMRGHCIFWAKDEFNTEWLKRLDTDELRGKVINLDAKINLRMTNP